jgi:phosphopantothenoylcysteine decarboxylase/phosphopantothenate--cysteine ligase
MKVLIAVTASIAAYRAAEVVSRLVQAGIGVNVIMTSNAVNLVGPATFKALTGAEVKTDLWESGTARPIHIELASEPDVVAVVPATADIIGKAARGICDDLVSTVLLSTTRPTLIAPAMNEDMYLHPAVQENLGILRQRGTLVVEPGTGWLACGKQGKGRLADPETIVEGIMDAGSVSGDLAGRKMVVSGGPTREPIDRVRYISNRSSGKMARAVARAARRRGAETVLVNGPVDLPAPAGVRTVRVETGEEMASALREEWVDADCLVMAAAVSDFKPAGRMEDKIRRSGELSLKLVPIPDIVASMASDRGSRIVVGFALETADEVRAGKRKMEEKDLDLVFVNNPLREGAGFGSENNAGWLIDRRGEVREIAPADKVEIAEVILDAVVDLLARSAGGTGSE